LGGRETAVPWRSINKKTRIEKFDPGFKFYPAGAVQVNSPVPFSERVETVAAESDFQSRPVIFRTNQASVFRQLSVRGRHLNREHRRANVYIPKTFGTRKPLAES
jgi:hypothetical protein